MPRLLPTVAQFAPGVKNAVRPLGRCAVPLPRVALPLTLGRRPADVPPDAYEKFLTCTSVAMSFPS